ncbi:MAG: signal peptidase I [Thaumarchaeota archaeon]|nr:signal peptidase I [Nitrososphaerota archaeon]
MGLLSSVAYSVARPVHLLTGFRIEVKDRSMEPLYPAGTRLWVSRIAYLLREPRRGDVVVVRRMGGSDLIVLKRVVGLPGERVSWTTHGLNIDGVAFWEHYVSSVPVPGDEYPVEHQLGLDEYYVLGDNRLYSEDSRHYGPVKSSMILGKVV